MDKEKRKHFKELLNKKLAEMLQDAGETVNDMSGSDDDHFADPTDRATHETDRNFLLRVKDRERKLVAKIKEALVLIEDESYGTCEFCGEDISFERLEVRPVTTSCIECKKEEEEEEKQRKRLRAPSK